MKKTSLVALVALTASVMADDMGKSNNKDADQKAAQREQQMAQRPDSGMMNVSSYPLMDSCKWDFFADVTYWRAEQGGTEWAFVNQDVTDDGVAFGEGNVKEVNFKWDWGFKVGVGYNDWTHDEWDMQLYYTWFRANKKDSAAITTTSALSAIDGGIDPFFTFPNNIGASPFQSGQIDWKINYSMFDLDLGRGYMVSKHLAMRPHVGVKGGWIDQKIAGSFTSFTGLTTAYTAKNNFWGVGPSGGVSTKWELGNWETHFFSLFGDFSGAWMWGHWTVHHSFDDEALVPQRFTGLNKDLGALMVQAFMGFGWETNLGDDSFHLGVRLGYEVQQWFNQNQMFPPDEGFRYNYDLTLQGGTLDFRFDF